MMKYEFEQLAGYEVSYEDYTNIIEPMYMATDLTKQEFVKVIDKKRFEVKHQKSQEQIEMEDSVKAEIKELKKEIEWSFKKIEMYKGFYESDGNITWKASIKVLRTHIRDMKRRIYSLRFVLS